jgi:hypothetical protein
MPATHRIDREHLLVVITWPAMVPDIGSTRATVAAILTSLHAPAGFGILSDWRQATSAASAAYVREFVEILRSAQKSGITRWATVVAPESLAAFGAGRMTEIQSELHGLSYRVFRDYDSAMHWLTTGVEP